ARALERLAPLLLLLAEEDGDVDRLRGAALCAARAGEQVVDHADQALHLLERDPGLLLHLRLAGGERDLLQAHGERGERRAELVRGVGGELPLDGETRREA